MDQEVQDADSTDILTEELHSPEYLQRKLYFLSEQLKSMHSELPESFQMRIPYELLTALANSLVNDTIFEIVKRLMEIQHVTENHLQQLRKQVENEHQSKIAELGWVEVLKRVITTFVSAAEIQEWISKISDAEELEHILALMKIKHAKRLKETDMKLVLHLDQKVKDQQTTLENAGVPGFYVTENAKEITIQMHLLDFILRLSRIKFETAK
ncbi:Gonadal protein gdl [Pseudolycoriella hygida]|uniref:Gonadal protein gdl n=1 Tax=Pseudolycoriella hygida TaxID=35572 RepID=A0A9Q0S772_9DIPT|nr:Gonadal protein gdl [Pseudolycoriella hygida]